MLGRRLLHNTTMTLACRKIKQVTCYSTCSTWVYMSLHRAVKCGPSTLTKSRLQTHTYLLIITLKQVKTHNSYSAQRYTKPSVFNSSIHRIHPLYATYFFLASLCSIPPPLIAQSIPLPSNSFPFLASISYHSDLIFISVLFFGVFLPRSPVCLRLFPAVFVHCSPSTGMRCL